MSKQRLLYLSHLLPYPPDYGAAIRTYNILRLLAEQFDVTALCFFRREATTSSLSLQQRVDALKSKARVEVFPIPQEHSRWRLLWDHLRSVSTLRPYTYYVHDSVAFTNSLARHLSSTKYDIVHVDSLDLVRFLPRLKGLPIVCTHHNVESALLRRRAATVPQPLRAYLRLQGSLLEREERRWLSKMDLNISVSEVDADALRRLSPAGRYTTIPNGVDTSFFRPVATSQRPSGCVFVGGTNWFPNKDALEWFAGEILPLVRSGGETSPMRWVGTASTHERQLQSAEGLELTGYVDDIRPFVQAAACFVVPLRIGGGTRLKVLDAWAMGKAVVSTSVGCEGLATEPGRNILIANTASDFANAIIRVLNDEPLRVALSKAGRRTVEQHYSWDVIGSRLRAAYGTVLSAAQFQEPGTAASGAGGG